ncbi:MAG: hypothetical protein WAL22_18315 [Solirubrobacteraceae bacterium]
MCGARASRALIDRRVFYVVHEPLRQMHRYYARDRPTGARQIAAGSSTGRGVPANLNLTWQWHPDRPGIVSEQTLIDMVTLPSGATGSRVDAPVIYRVPRPAGEQVPAGVTEVDITRAAPGQMPDLSRTVTEPTSACDALAFTTGTRTWPSLLRGARFLHQVDRLVHTRFATITPIPPAERRGCGTGPATWKR